MKLKTVRNVVRAFIAAYFLLALIIIITKSTFFVWVMLALVVPVAVIVHKYWRCPKCRALFGKTAKRCPHCGEELDL